MVGLGLAGAFVGAGVYFALRVTPAATPAPGAQAASGPVASTSIASGSVGSDGTGGGGSAATTAGSGGAPVGNAGVPGTPAARMNDEVKRGFEAQRAHLAETCWAPSFAKRAAPPLTTIFFTLTFAEDGHLSSRGLREDPTTGRPEVTSCVQHALVVPPITPRGVRSRVEYTLTLP